MVLSFTHGMKKHRKMFYRNKMTPFELDIIKLSNDGQKSADCWLYVCKKSEEADKRS